MRTVWIALAVYLVLYALTAAITGDSDVIVAGLLVGLVAFAAATLIAGRAQKVRPGRRPLGER
jgi:hypothetical protein